MARVIVIFKININKVSIVRTMIEAGRIYPNWVDRL